MCDLLCQRSRVRFSGFTSNPSLDLLGTYPGCQRCESRSGEKMIVNQQIQHFGLYAFAAGEREDLWHSGVSLARLESVSFVEKVGTKAKKMGGGKTRKGILFSPPPSSIFLLSLLLSRSNSSGNICYAVISTRYRLRRTLRVGGKDVFSLCCLQSLLMKMNPLSIKVLCKKS